jgi:hypothetical protein
LSRPQRAVQAGQDPTNFLCRATSAAVWPHPSDDQKEFLSLYHLFTEFSRIAFSRMINPPLVDQAPQPLAAT